MLARAPNLPAFFAKDSRLLEFFIFFLSFFLFFFFLATKSQVGGRQREKLVANGELATGNFEHWKRVSKNEKPELSRRSVINFDQDVFHYALQLEDAYVNVAIMKSVNKCLSGVRIRS